LDNLFSTHPSTDNRVAELEKLAAELGPGPSRVPHSARYDRSSGVSGPWGSAPEDRPRGPWG
jgi:heat shock protein HtpX